MARMFFANISRETEYIWDFHLNICFAHASVSNLNDSSRTFSDSVAEKNL